MFVLIIIAVIVGVSMIWSYRNKDEKDKSVILPTFAIVFVIVSMGYLMIVKKAFSSYVDKKSNSAEVFQIVSLDNPNSDAFTIRSNGEKNTEDYTYSFFVQNRDKSKTKTIIPSKDTKIIESNDRPEYQIINCTSGYELSYLTGWYTKTDPCEAEISRILKVPVGTIILGEL